MFLNRTGRDEKNMIKRKRNKSNIINDGIKLIVQCKSGGLCIKNPRTMADVICEGCERNNNLVLTIERNTFKTE
jgi:hypothetical protein